MGLDVDEPSIAHGCSLRSSEADYTMSRDKRYYLNHMTTCDDHPPDGEEHAASWSKRREAR